jgi:homoserine kinase type II
MRLGRIEQIMTQGMERLASSIRRAESSAVAQRGLRLLELFPLVAPASLESLRRLGEIPVPQQPSIRDIWHKHVLLTGQEVTGLIDFGAMRIESVAGDVARLLGTLVRDDPAGWQDGLAAYQSVRPLAPQERMLVSAFDQGNVALSGLQWLEWLYIQGRRFENEQGVLERLDESLGRMQHFAGNENSAGTLARRRP